MALERSGRRSTVAWLSCHTPYSQALETYSGTILAATVSVPAAPVTVSVTRSL